MEDFKMINLTDMELCMLEQLTYLDEEVAAAAGVNTRFGKINTDMVNKTVGDILSNPMNLSCSLK